ncbi:TPA: 5-amino-6-(5-phospho-D-ribitylamino)uracil phosphatase YigB [Vibrio vulnificus]|uniref:5-amino-6-(5-phospho-D-ribitylamino)uracil phosphatase YigB n=1 Tax=Vibrio vulnificus TaxID=672 RepID=UPI001302251C|nr:5-amino-6-(5-phospho-D-ribitylamino)uracil phosphatase YigB [Vibrio vulnificus]MCU8206924.1 5-amino-6-(5-phospho-D-ribitylamino)uracil phosphatase YigB [Vibrio vulnificus]HAS8423692.1 5-amino-6-(5-phospho-D-ribitylamino)uracil phosphatase YigB [Vibrio vulnificus]
MKHYRPLQPIAAMTFDLDDTLYDNRPVIERLEREMLAWLATQHPATQVMSHSDWSQLKRDVAASSPQLRSDVTQLRHQQLTEAFLRLGYDVAAAQQAADEGVAVALYWRSQLVVPSETHRVMRLLADKLPLVAITNGNVDVAAIGLQGYFQAVLKAGPDGVAKPAGDLFQRAEQILQLPAQRILHVGDHLLSDVHGANLHGFMSCWINPKQINLRQQAKAKTLPNLEINELSQLLLLL